MDLRVLVVTALGSLAPTALAMLINLWSTRWRPSSRMMHAATEKAASLEAAESAANSGQLSNAADEWLCAQRRFLRVLAAIDYEQSHRGRPVAFAAAALPYLMGCALMLASRAEPAFYTPGFYVLSFGSATVSVAIVYWAASYRRVLTAIRTRVRTMEVALPTNPYTRSPSAKRLNAGQAFVAKASATQATQATRVHVAPPAGLGRWQARLVG